MSSQPSLSKSKSATPDTIVSGWCLRSVRPGFVTKRTPRAGATSSKTMASNAGGAAAQTAPAATRPMHKARIGSRYTGARGSHRREEARMRPNGSPTGLRVETWLTALFLGASFPLRAAAETEADPGGHLQLAITSAESSLQKGQREAAEKRYREALFEGWLLMGRLDSAAAPSPEAR